MLEREVGEVEIDPFEQQVGRHDQRLAASRGDDRRVVAHTPQGRLDLRLESLREGVDETEFPQFGDLRPFVLFHASDRILHKSSENFAVSQLRFLHPVRRSCPVTLSFRQSSCGEQSSSTGLESSVSPSTAQSGQRR